MSVEVVVSANFKRKAKKYIKKFRSLKEELAELEKSLWLNPKQGDRISESIYKIRLASKSKGKGKSGGFRIITYLIESMPEDQNEVIVTLLSIYDKSEVSTLSDAEIKNLVEDFLFDRENEDGAEGDEDQ
jgi:mRNA-degrading endonuclease RelE of RelBE toxin-antitoxin system